MTKSEKYEKKAEELLLPIVEKHNFEIVDIEYIKEHSNFYLRAYIDKTDGITIDDCELVSRELSDLLDIHDFINDSYILEVSSPGLGRKLKKDKDLLRSIGEEVEIKLYKAIDKKKEFIGVLSSFNENEIVIIPSTQEKLSILRENIAVIRLTFDF